MQQELIDEIAKFILYLENVDGDSWNSLLRELSATYEARQGLMFYGLGIERCYTFADRWFGQYWYSFCPREIKYDFRRHQTSVSLFAAAEILSGAEKEFKIGNFFH